MFDHCTSVPICFLPPLHRPSVLLPSDPVTAPSNLRIRPTNRPNSCSSVSRLLHPWCSFFSTLTYDCDPPLFPTSDVCPRFPRRLYRPSCVSPFQSMVNFDTSGLFFSSPLLFRLMFPHPTSLSEVGFPSSLSFPAQVSFPF